MRRLCLVVCLCLCFFFSACSQQNAASQMPAAPFEAELQGQACGIAFQAKLVMQARGEGTCAPATLTFYAPRELAGTMLSRDATGNVTMTYGDVTLCDVGGVGVLLLSVFPEAKEAQRATVNVAGNTVVLFEQTEIEFSGDGVPLFIKNDDVQAQIVSFKCID